MTDSRISREQSISTHGVMELAPLWEGPRLIDCRVVTVNDICLNLFRSSALPDDINTLSEFIPDEESFQSLMRNLDTGLKTSSSPDFGFLLMRFPGGVFISVQHQSSQSVRLVCVDASDVVDRVLCSDDACAHMQKPAAVLDTEGKTLSVSGEWERTFGYEKSRLLGKELITYVHPADRECAERMFLPGTSDGKPYTNMIRFLTSQDSYRTLELFVVRAGGNLLVYGNDITGSLEQRQFIDRQAHLYALFMDSPIAGIFFSMREEPIAISSIDTGDEALLLSLMDSEHIIEVNETFLTQVQKPREVILGSALSDFFHWDIGRGIHHYRTALREGKVVAEGRFPVPDDSERWISVNISNIYDEEGRLKGHVGFQMDVTVRKQQEQELRRRENDYRILTEFARDMLWIYNLDADRFTFLSPAVEGILGWTPDEMKRGGLPLIIGEQTLRTLVIQIDRFREEFRQTGRVGTDATLRIDHTRKDGRTVHSESLLNFRYNEEHELEVIGISRDVSEKKRAEEHLVFTSYHDQLTGVYNRRFLKDFLSEGLNRSHFPLSIILCDLNGLKLTNDVFGHSFGDALIVENAQLLTSFARSNDIVTREGGDEFIMLLPATAAHEARRFVNEMRNRSRGIRVNELQLSSAFGTATMERMGDEYYEAYHAAEKQLYSDKLRTSPEYKKQLIGTFLSSLFSSDTALERHSLSVSALCGRIAQELSLDRMKTEQLILAGRLHDIGIIGLDTKVVPDVDYKMREEIGEYARHPELGYRIISSVPMYGEIATWVLAHHEQPDGKGYPGKLSGADIPLEAHIIHVANDYDLLMEKYRQDARRVLSVMEQDGRRRYPVKVLKALRACIEKGSF